MAEVGLTEKKMKVIPKAKNVGSPRRIPPKKQTPKLKDDAEGGDQADAAAPSESRGQPDRHLVIHEARYGYADPLWTPAVCKAALGLQDVTLVVRSLVSRNELHVNPDRKPQYMNQIFAFSDPTPKKRRLGVRFSYGDGPIYEMTTDGVDQETVALHVTDGPVEEGGPAQGWVGKLKLLNRQDENVLRFPDLRTGGAFSRLRCTGSRIMGGIVLEYPETRQAGPWAYTEIGLGPVGDAISVSYDGEFVMRDDGRVLDVSMWSYEVHNHLVIIRGPNDAETFQGRGGNGGRSFTLNDDQTISPTQAPHLALGVVPKTLRVVAPQEIKAAACTRRDEKDEAMKRLKFLSKLEINHGDLKSQMRLLQTGPTVDTLLEVLTPTAFKDIAFGEGWCKMPVWENLETATFFLTLVSDVLRADARMCDNILKDVSGRECGQLQTALLRFISGAGNKIVHDRGYPRIHTVQVPVTDNAAYLLTEVLVQRGAMDSEVLKELVTRLVGRSSYEARAVRDRELMMGALTKLMEQPDHREFIESQPGVRSLLVRHTNDPAELRRLVAAGAANLKDPDQEVRKEAAEFLGNLALEDLVTHSAALIARLEASDEFYYVRKAVEQSLGKLAPKMLARHDTALAARLKVYTEKVEAVCKAAANGPKITCPAGHMLKYDGNSVYWYCCNGQFCPDPSGRTKNRWGCTECDYDLCGSCFDCAVHNQKKEAASRHEGRMLQVEKPAAEAMAKAAAEALDKLKVAAEAL